jgi:hypothetical protein
MAALSLRLCKQKRHGSSFRGVSVFLRRVQEN